MKSGDESKVCNDSAILTKFSLIIDRMRESLSGKQRASKTALLKRYCLSLWMREKVGIAFLSNVVAIWSYNSWQTEIVSCASDAKASYCASSPRSFNHTVVSSKNARRFPWNALGLWTIPQYLVNTSISLILKSGFDASRLNREANTRSELVKRSANLINGPINKALLSSCVLRGTLPEFRRWKIV